jgi:methyl-accepting chemotaxis protein
MIKADQFAAEQLPARAGRGRCKIQLNRLGRGFETKVCAMPGILTSGAAEFEATARSIAGTATRTNGQAMTVVAAAARVGVSTVASAAEERTASISEMSCQVAQPSRIARRPVRDAQRTDVIVGALAERTERIGQGVELITNIAGQTNPLALSATLEPARAGDAEKGFAAVASAVKSLANHTAKATKEIGAPIAQIKTATKEAVDAIRGSPRTIQEVSSISMSIATAVEEQGAVIAEIACNIQQTAQSAHGVTPNICGVRQATTETGMDAARVLRAAADLWRQAEQRTSEVGNFIAHARAA